MVDSKSSNTGIVRLTSIVINRFGANRSSVIKVSIFTRFSYTSVESTLIPRSRASNSFSLEISSIRMLSYQFIKIIQYPLDLCSLCLESSRYPIQFCEFAISCSWNQFLEHFFHDRSSNQDTAIYCLGGRDRQVRPPQTAEANEKRRTTLTGRARSPEAMAKYHATIAARKAQKEAGA